MSSPCDVVGIGLNATDTLILVPEYPAYAGKIAFDREILSPGGQVATTVVACSRLGLQAKYVGTIGDDARGQIQQESLRGTGVDTSAVIIRSGCPNQTAYILIDQRTGERTVLWQRDKCLRLRPEELSADDIVNARLLHIDGCDIEAAAFAASIARQAGVLVSLDVDTVYPGFEVVLQNVDYLVAGNGWPERWTGESDPFAALSKLKNEFSFTVAATTLGTHGALALYEDRWFYSPGFEVSCVDTTGAGDVFHGAFCYCMLQKFDMVEALEFSNAAAALSCTAIGARGHIPTCSEVAKLRVKAQAGSVGRRDAPEISQRCSARVGAEA